MAFIACMLVALMFGLALGALVVAVKAASQVFAAVTWALAVGHELLTGMISSFRRSLPK
jgi:hypothetical protein